SLDALPRTALVHRQQEQRVVCQNHRKTPVARALDRHSGADEEGAEVIARIAPAMLVVVIACGPQTAKCGNRRDAGAVSFHDAADLADRAGVIVEMFECLAGRDAIERPAAKRQPGQIAEDDGDAHVAANVQHGVKRSIDSEYSEALLLQPLRELPEPNGGVENA